MASLQAIHHGDEGKDDYCTRVSLQLQIKTPIKLQSAHLLLCCINVGTVWGPSGSKMGD